MVHWGGGQVRKRKFRFPPTPRKSWKFPEILFRDNGDSVSQNQEIQKRSAHSPGALRVQKLIKHAMPRFLANTLQNGPSDFLVKGEKVGFRCENNLFGKGAS